jgi:DNA modification methylase
MMEQQHLPGISERNQLYCGDCLVVLDMVPDSSIDLIYIDPPFYSQRVYETIWGEEAERFAFEDRWSGGINHYVNYLVSRIKKMHAKLKDAGSFYIHLDWHISHYMKVELDKLFGYGNLQNEIIWQRTSAHSDAKRFGHIHDTLFFYSKSGTFTWNPLFGPHSPEYVQKFYRFNDAVRGQYRLDHIIRSQSMGPRPNLSYEYKRFRPQWGWRVNREKLKKLDADGRIEWSKTGRPYLRRYLNEMKGTALTSMWTDIVPVQAHAKERLGYPTQKPLALLERIVTASSNRGDLVMDAYCGCGTTLAAAQKLGRRWIGVDISQSAIRVVEQRLRKLGATNYEVHGLVKSIKELRALDPFEFQNWAINAVYGQHSPRKIADMGIDGFTFMERHPIQVKQMDHVGRPVIDAFAGALQREKEKRGMVIAFGFTSGAIDEVARLEREDKVRIELVKCSDLVAGNVPYKIMI